MKQPRLAVASFIANELADKTDSMLPVELAGYLIAENRSGELEHIMRDVVALRALNGIIEADVRSARPLSSETRTAVKKLIKKWRPDAKRIILNESVEPSLISGFTVDMPGERIDMSAAGKLRAFRRAVKKEQA